MSEESDLDDIMRIGIAWRELRRGGTAQSFRREVYGGDVDLGTIDALDLLVAQGGCRMSELADALRVDPSTATRAVDRLVAAGYAERQASTEDARVVVVVATPEGKAHQETLAALRREALVAVLAVFDAGERRQLADLLDRMVQSADEYRRRD